MNRQTLAAILASVPGLSALHFTNKRVDAYLNTICDWDGIRKAVAPLFYISIFTLIFGMLFDVPVIRTLNAALAG